METLYQLNFQTKFGGGEVYTHFLCQALSKLRQQHQLLAHTQAHFWSHLKFEHNNITYIQNDIKGIINQLPSSPTSILTHGPIPNEWLQVIKNQGHHVYAIAHMPLYQRDQQVYQGYDGILGVSQYVISSLQDAGYTNIYPVPWYGIASLKRTQSSKLHTITQNSHFDWDLRKGRDRILSWLEPFYRKLKPTQTYHKLNNKITIGIVSRITPIKQFPLLFKYLSPILAQYPNITINIFGAGGYASIRDLKQALSPIKSQVRFWGHQEHIETVYDQIDYLLTGLPEKEALGLNVIEAQFCNVPVLAVDAPPFIETVIPNKTGYLFTDPRKDQGQSFQVLLDQITNLSTPMLTPKNHHEHLDQFSFNTFVQRVEQTLPWLKL